MTCPPGSGQSDVNHIGADGGTIVFSWGTGAFSLDLPRGALTGSTAIRVKELADPTPADYTDYSPIYAITPADLRLRLPARLDITWDLVFSPGAGLMSPAEVAIYRADSLAGPWTRLSDSVVNAGKSSATIDRFGFVFVGYPSAIDSALCRRLP